MCARWFSGGRLHDSNGLLQGFQPSWLPQKPKTTGSAPTLSVRACGPGLDPRTAHCRGNKNALNDMADSEDWLDGKPKPTVTSKGSAGEGPSGR